MASFLLIVLSIGLTIAKQNEFLIVSNWLLYVCYGLTILSLLSGAVFALKVGKGLNKRF